MLAWYCWRARMEVLSSIIYINFIALILTTSWSITTFFKLDSTLIYKKNSEVLAFRAPNADPTLLSYCLTVLILRFRLSLMLEITMIVLFCLQ